MAVSVLDKRGKPLMPCTEKRARLLLERGRARGHRLVPFVIRLVDRTQEDCELQPLRLKIDPGSKATGLALVQDTEFVCETTGEVTRHAGVLNLFELQHRGLAIKCTGRGSYQRTRLNKYGFPRGYLMRQKQVQGFQTGDRVKAVVPTGKKAGVHVGRVAVRQSGSFNIQTLAGAVQGISHKYCRLLQQADGYGYQQIAQHDTEEAGTRVA